MLSPTEHLGEKEEREEEEEKEEKEEREERGRRRRGGEGGEGGNGGEGGEGGEEVSNNMRKNFTNEQFFLFLRIEILQLADKNPLAQYTGFRPHPLIMR